MQKTLFFITSFFTILLMWLLLIWVFPLTDKQTVTFGLLKKLLIAFVLSFIVFIASKKIPRPDIFTIFLSYAFFFVSFTLYIVLFPTMADRSFSVKMLLYIQEKHTLSAKELVTKMNLEKKSLFKKRIEDFVKTDLITLKKGNIFLTKKGTFIADLYLIHTKIFKASIRPKIWESDNEH